MKLKSYIKCILFAVITIICGCTDETTEQIRVEQPNSFHLETDGDESFALDVSAGDKISINGYKIPVLSNGLVSLHDVPAAENYFICYPDSFNSDEDKISYSMPQEQTYKADGIDVASCPFSTLTDNKGLDSVKLKPIMGALKMTIPANADFGTVSSISIESESDVLNGKLQIDSETGKITNMRDKSGKVIINGPIDISENRDVYLALPPQKCTGKFNIKFFSPKGYGTYTLDLTDKTIEQAKTLAVTLDNIDWHYATYYYGIANSVLVKPGQTSVTVDCGAYYTASKVYAYENNIADNSRLAFSVRQLWNDVSADFVKGVTLAGDRKSFTVNLNGETGNAVIAIYDKKNPDDSDTKILWSFHIWVTDVNEQQLGVNVKGNDYTILDRNIGATSATSNDVHSIGMLYQWGRKDPFVSTGTYGQNGNAKMYNENGEVTFSTVKGGATSGTVQYAIEHPDKFILYSRSSSNKTTYPYYSAYDWLYYADCALWGNPEGYNYPLASTIQKSIYDPSPAGYMVAPSDTWLGTTEGFDKTNSIFANYVWKDGYIKIETDEKQRWYPMGGWRSRKNGSLATANTNGYYWYSCIDGKNTPNALLMTISKDAVKTNSVNCRANSSSVRCVKIIK